MPEETGLESAKDDCKAGTHFDKKVDGCVPASPTPYEIFIVNDVEWFWDPDGTWVKVGEDLAGDPTSQWGQVVYNRIDRDVL